MQGALAAHVRPGDAVSPCADGVVRAGAFLGQRPGGEEAEQQHRRAHLDNGLRFVNKSAPAFVFALVALLLSGSAGLLRGLLGAA